MKRGDRDSRLRWAFGLAVLLHAGALAVLAHLPLAQASSALDDIAVFGARAPFSGSLLAIVDLPPSGAASPGPVFGTAPEPGPKQESPPKPAARRAAPARPERPADQRSAGPEPRDEPVKPAAAPPSPTAPSHPGARNEEPVDLGPPSPVGAVPEPGGPVGEGEGPAAAPAGGDRGGRTDVPRGGREGPGGGPDGGPEGDGGPAVTGEPTGEPGEPAGSTEPGPPEVQWANPKVLRAPLPAYPEAAAENGVEGTVVMKVLVGERGEVVEVKVLRSSHDPRLDEAALTAVRGWRYQPATQDGKPRRVYTRATVQFKLP
jgi:protein TonB